MWRMFVDTLENSKWTSTAPVSLMPKLDQKRVQEATRKRERRSWRWLHDARSMRGAFARSMKQAAFAYDKACLVAKQITATDA